MLVGLYARLQRIAQPALPPRVQVRVPLLAALRSRPRQILLCTGIAFGYVPIAYIGSTFFLAYATQIGYGSTEALLFDICTSVAIVISAPLFAALSDRLGRRKVMIAGAVLMTAGFFILFTLLGLHNMPLALFAYVLAGALMGATQGPIPAFLAVFRHVGCLPSRCGIGRWDGVERSDGDSNCERAQFAKGRGLHGTDYPRQTLARGVIQCSERFQALLNLMRNRLLESLLIHCNETRVHVLKEPDRVLSSRSRIEVQTTGSSDKPMILFDYSKSRAKEVFARQLEGYHGCR